MGASESLAEDARAVAARGAAAWPDVAVDVDALAAHVAQLVGAEREPAAALARVNAEDVCLAFACARGEAAALAALEQRYLRELAGPLRRMHLDAQAIDDAMQALRDQQLVGGAEREPGILRYSGRGPLRAWLRSVAVRLAMRDRKRGGRTDPFEAGVHATPDDDLEIAYMKKQYGAAFERAFAAAVRQLAVEDRLLLKQRFGHRVGVVELGKLYGVNAGTISRRVAAARERLVAATRAQMVAELGIASGEVSSILRLIESQMDVSLSAVA